MQPNHLPPTPALFFFHPFFFSNFPSAWVVCERNKADRVPGWGVRSFFSPLSTLAGCWSGLLEEGGKDPFPQRAIWPCKTHSDANLLISFSLVLSFLVVVPKAHFIRSCKLRPGPSEGEHSSGAHLLWHQAPTLTPAPLSPCRCRDIIVITGGSMRW